MSPNIAIVTLLTTFVLLITIKYPITFSMIISTAFTMLYTQVPVTALVQQMSKQLNSFSPLVIPFFILMKETMAAGGISSRLLTFASIRVGQIIGGLAYVNILTSVLFGGISGPAIADVPFLGALEIPMMEEAEHEKDFSIAVTVTSSCQGLIIPPSHDMVLYPMVIGGVPVGNLFRADYIPGIMLGISIMVVCYTISKRKHYPKGKRLSFKETLRVTKDTFFATPVMAIIAGGVSTGFFTATESAAVSCTYCLFIGFFIYRELHLEDIPVMLRNTVKAPSMVHALIVAADTFRWVMVYLNAPTLATSLLLDISSNKIVTLFLINLILFLLRCVMDLAPPVPIMAPISLPVVTKSGMNPIQFGVMMMLNLGIGLHASPVGAALFIGCAIGNMKIEKVSKAILPLYIPMLITLLPMTFIPALAMALPELIMK